MTTLLKMEGSGQICKRRCKSTFTHWCFISVSEPCFVNFLQLFSPCVASPDPGLDGALLVGLALAVLAWVSYFEDSLEPAVRGFEDQLV